MTLTIHSSSAVLHHLSATTAAVSTGENCSLKSVSLKRKSPPPPSSPSDEPSLKKITLHSPPSSSSSAAERVPEKTPSPAFSPFSSKRVSDKSPFSTCSTNPAISLLPFSRFTAAQPHNNSLRRTLSEPPVFNSFTAFVAYMNSQSPENNAKKNSNISAFKWQRPLRRSISVPTDADILAPAAVNLLSNPSLNSEKTTKRKILNQFLNEGDDTEDTCPEYKDENNINNSEGSKQFVNENESHDKGHSTD